MQKFFAHSVEGKPTSEWHGLEKHLKGTAELAAKFAAEFGSGEWAYLAGLYKTAYRFRFKSERRSRLP